MARRHPRRQMPPGGVPHHRHPAQVEVILTRDLPKMVGVRSNVEHCVGPAPTFVAQPSILDAPRGDPLGCECRAEMPDMFEIIPGPPETAMYHHRHHVRSLAPGKPKVTELQWIS